MVNKRKSNKIAEAILLSNAVQTEKCYQITAAAMKKQTAPFLQQQNVFEKKREDESTKFLCYLNR